MYNEKLKITRKNDKKQGKKFFFNNPPVRETKKSKSTIQFDQFMMMETILASILIGIGVICYLFIYMNPMIIQILLGLYMIACGLLELKEYQMKDHILLFKKELYYAVVNFLLGILVFINLIVLHQNIVIYFAIWLIIKSIIKISRAFQLKRLSEQSWLYQMVVALTTLVMAIIIFVNPFPNLLITEILGTFAILNGIIDAASSMLLKKRVNDLMNNLE